MFTRSQIHQFTKTCDKCGQFNCCTHLPKQNVINYDIVYKYEFIRHINKFSVDMKKVKGNKNKAKIAHEIFSYMINNLIFLVKHRNCLTECIDKLNEFQETAEKKWVKII